MKRVDVKYKIKCDNIIEEKVGGKKDLESEKDLNKEVYKLLDYYGEKYGVGLWKNG
jgi:hypothetical protein